MFKQNRRPSSFFKPYLQELTYGNINSTANVCLSMFRMQQIFGAEGPSKDEKQVHSFAELLMSLNARSLSRLEKRLNRGPDDRPFLLRPLVESPLLVQVTLIRLPAYYASISCFYIHSQGSGCCLEMSERHRCRGEDTLKLCTHLPPHL